MPVQPSTIKRSDRHTVHRHTVHRSFMQNSEIRLAYIALAAICIIWGTTYAGIKVAVDYFPPFMLAALRQVLAGAILLMWAWRRGKLQSFDRTYLWKQALAGTLMIAGGNGFLTWGLQYVSSGLSAVIGSLTPLMVLLIAFVWKGEERMTWPIFFGVLLGFVGMALIFNNGWADFLNPEYRLGIFACFGSLITWSLGTVMAKRFNSPEVPPIANAALQVSSGGLVLLLLSLIFDPHHTITHTWAGWGAMLYLLVFGSVLGFSLYMYVLTHLSATVSSLYTYINPVVAILLGWLFLGERFTYLEGTGMALTILGVYVANSTYLANKRKERKAKRESQKMKKNVSF